MIKDSLWFEVEFRKKSIEELKNSETVNKLHLIKYVSSSLTEGKTVKELIKIF